MSRLPYASISPDGFQPLQTLSDYAKQSGLESALLHIVYLRISQINGCPYCIDLHWRDARAEGVDERKLNGVVLWRDMPFFSDRERAALAWAEAVTLLRDQHVSDEEFGKARAHFNDKELVDLTLAIANMNALNRVAIAFHSVPVAPRKDVMV
jgi:AhpD family alkylhydroperoxidase